LGLAVTVQAVYYPKLTVQTSVLTLTCFGTGCLFLILHRQYFKKGGSGK
jgi:hypothetical protein